MQVEDYSLTSIQAKTKAAKLISDGIELFNSRQDPGASFAEASELAVHAFGMEEREREEQQANEAAQPSDPASDVGPTPEAVDRQARIMDMVQKIEARDAAVNQVSGVDWIDREIERAVMLDRQATAGAVDWEREISLAERLR